MRFLLKYHHTDPLHSRVYYSHPKNRMIFYFNQQESGEIKFFLLGRDGKPDQLWDATKYTFSSYRKQTGNCSLLERNILNHINKLGLRRRKTREAAWRN